MVAGDDMSARDDDWTAWEQQEYQPSYEVAVRLACEA